MAEPGTRIDWWVISRDTLFFLTYLIIMSAFISSNEITITNAFILIVLYVVHITAMKYNTIYEVAIKKNVARFMEIRELTKLAENDIDSFHKNLNSRSLTIEILKNLEYRVEEKYIVFEGRYRKRIRDPTVVISDEDIPFSMMDNRSFISKMLWKKAAIKIIIRIQAYKFFEKIRRNRKSAVDLVRILPYMANGGDNGED